MPLFKYLGGPNVIVLPVPMANVINGAARTARGPEDDYDNKSDGENEALKQAAAGAALGDRLGKLFGG